MSERKPIERPSSLHWCDYCQDASEVDHFDEKFNHRVGAEFGPTGQEMAERDCLRADLSTAREALERADMALGYIVDDAINRLTKDSPMLLIDVRKLDGVVGILRQALASLNHQEGSE